MTDSNEQTTTPKDDPLSHLVGTIIRQAILDPITNDIVRVGCEDALRIFAARNVEAYQRFVTDEFLPALKTRTDAILAGFDQDFSERYPNADEKTREASRVSAKRRFDRVYELTARGVVMNDLRRDAMLHTWKHYTDPAYNDTVECAKYADALEKETHEAATSGAGD